MKSRSVPRAAVSHFGLSCFGNRVLGGLDLAVMPVEGSDRSQEPPMRTTILRLDTRHGHVKGEEAIGPIIVANVRRMRPSSGGSGARLC